MRGTILLNAAAIAALGALSSVEAAFCNGSPSPDAQPNGYPIGTGAPTFIKSVPNGKLYSAGAAGFEFNVAHLWGTPYDMGYAHGQLFGDIATNVSNAVWAYFEEQVTSNLTFLPAWLADIIANYGLEVALDVIADLTAPSTPAHFLQELQGLADATGVDYKRLLRISLIGELTQGDCSMVGAWGPATAGGKTLAARALDWDTDIPAVQYPTVFIYHPEQGNGHAFANVGFVGWIGALSGQSAAQMSIHEIGVSYPDATFGNESFAGVPFVFLLRDILQYDNNLNDTIARITGANRTCDLILGAGSGTDGSFRAFEYSASVANVFDDTNQMPLACEWNGLRSLGQMLALLMVTLACNIASSS